MYITVYDYTGGSNDGDESSGADEASVSHAYDEATRCESIVGVSISSGR